MWKVCSRPTRNDAQTKTTNVPMIRTTHVYFHQVFGSLSTAESGCQHVVIRTDCNWEKTREISSEKVTVTHVSSIFLDHWEILYWTPLFDLIDGETHFVGKFPVLCLLMRLKDLINSAYRQQKNCQAKRFNPTIPSQLRQYADNPQRSWDVQDECKLWVTLWICVAVNLHITCLNCFCKGHIYVVRFSILLWFDKREYISSSFVKIKNCTLFLYPSRKYLICNLVSSSGAQKSFWETFKLGTERTLLHILLCSDRSRNLTI